MELTNTFAVRVKLLVRANTEEAAIGIFSRFSSFKEVGNTARNMKVKKHELIKNQFIVTADITVSATDDFHATRIMSDIYKSFRNTIYHGQSLCIAEVGTSDFYDCFRGWLASSAA